MQIFTTIAFTVWASLAVAQDLGLFSNLERDLELLGHRALQAARKPNNTEIERFTTDGCSGGMSQVWASTANTFPAFTEAYGQLPPWEHCCVEHDRAYHRGGTDPEPAASYAARFEADAELRACVLATGTARAEETAAQFGVQTETAETIYSNIAEAMYLAVRLGGNPCSGLPWRWGYGWPACNPFAEQPGQ